MEAPPILANRLRKRFKHFHKWARRQGISCFRIYNHDIPEYPLIADYYEGRVVVWLSQRTRDVTEAEREAFRQDAVKQILEGLELEANNLFVKYRRPGGQYGARSQDVNNQRSSHEFVVTENNLKFLVNLSDYHDTGLFLDHRQTRARLASEAAGKAVLNLFCYTGSFTVYASAAGAASTVSVDLSSRYLDWAERNLQLNGLENLDNTLVEDDVNAWIRDAAGASQRFDLIICDPPTFSNSKSTAGIFDVERDHERLINGCLALLNPGGKLYFSTNKRNFQLNALSLPPFVLCQEITKSTIPPDFAANPPHKCYLFEQSANKA